MDVSANPLKPMDSCHEENVEIEIVSRGSAAGDYIMQSKVLERLENDLKEVFGS